MDDKIVTRLRVNQPNKADTAPNNKANNWKVKVTFNNAKMDSMMLHRREIVDELAQDEYRKDMSFHPERSFLEHIITLCKEQNIALFFVRVKRLRDLKPHKQSPELLKYISQLNSYLDEQNIPLIDFTDNRQIIKTLKKSFVVRLNDIYFGSTWNLFRTR